MRRVLAAAPAQGGSFRAKLCFAIAIGLLPIALAGSAAAAPQRWTVATDIDPADDGKTVAIERHIGLGAGQHAVLRVACAKGLPRVSLRSSHWIGRGRTRAIVRFNDAPPDSEEWIAAGPLAGPIDHAGDVALIRRMLAAKTLAVRLDFAPGGRAYMDTVFVQLGGFAAAFAPVARACNWSQLYDAR